MDNKNSICFYQKFIPKYRIIFFNILSDSLLKKNNTKIYFLIDCPKSFSFIPYFYKFEVVKALSLKSLKLIKKSESIIIEGSHKNIISYLFIIYSFIVKTNTIAYCHFIGSTRKELIKVKSLLRKIYLNLYRKIIFYYKNEIVLYDNVGHLYLSNKKTYFANNSINTNLINNYRKEYNSNSRDIDFICIGRITNKFNLNLLISALEISKNKTSINIVLIGSEKKETIFINTAYCIHKINFLENIFDEKTIAIYANNSKAFIYPGNVGLSIVHGMAYGLPILMHSEKSLHGPEGFLFQENKSGLYFKKDSIDDFSCKMTKILKNKQKLIYYSNQNLNIIRNNISLENMANNFSDAIYN